MVIQRCVQDLRVYVLAVYGCLPHAGDIVIFDHSFDGFALVLVALVPSTTCLFFRVTPVS
jgi:hypothetical protein